MDMSMGTLKPGATYIYERNGGTIYARESGSTDRHIVGYDKALEPTMFGVPASVVGKIIGIYQMSQLDPGMKELWDQLEVMYNLKKT
jgi:hypothetical protein